MDLKMKQRLVGLLVVLALLAIFMPMISYKMEPKQAIHLTTAIPNPPDLPKVQMASKSAPINSIWTQGVYATGTASLSSDAATPVKMAENTPQPIETEAQVQAEAQAEAKNANPIKSPIESKNTPSSVQSTKSQTGHWIIQLGSFSNSKNIQALLGKLSERHIPAYKEETFSGRGKIVRIFVGPVLTENQAAHMKNQIQQQLHISGIIKRKNA